MRWEAAFNLDRVPAQLPNWSNFMQKAFPNSHSSDWSKSCNSDWLVPCILSGCYSGALMGWFRGQMRIEFCSSDWMGSGVSVHWSKRKPAAPSQELTQWAGAQRRKWKLSLWLFPEMQCVCVCVCDRDASVSTDCWTLAVNLGSADHKEPFLANIFLTGVHRGKQILVNFALKAPRLRGEVRNISVISFFQKEKKVRKNRDFISIFYLH